MEPEEFTVVDPDGQTIVAFGWVPPHHPTAAIHIMHGRGEHARRYDRPARAFVDAGFAVYANDHRGHGQTGLRNGGLGLMGPRGMDGVVEAAHAVTEEVRRRHPELGIFALGHSWGSFILSRYLRHWASELAGALLTGTTHRDPNGPTPPRSGGLRAAFEGGRTRYDWLTRDEAEVDKYIADPMCGFDAVREQPPPAPPSSGELAAPHTPLPEVPIPTDLPIYIFNGGDDPIGGEEGGQRLAEHFRSLGVKDVTFRSYPGARHELFNETNREEVTRHVLAWLEAHA